jgi:thiol-disulfide isomerase/thioredoxin
MKNLSLFLLLIPAFGLGQSDPGISYEEGIAKCHAIRDEYQKANPDKLFYSGPECLVGARIPEFSATTLDGKTINQDYFKGKVTVINFWYASCTPCIAETPGLNAIMEKYGTDKVNYLGVSINDDNEVKEFVATYAWKFEQVHNGIDVNLNDFKIGYGYPTTFVVNKNSVIVGAFSGGKTDERAVQEIQDNLIPLIDASLQ